MPTGDWRLVRTAMKRQRERRGLPLTSVKRPSLTRCDATKFPTIIALRTQHPAPDIAPRTSHHLCSSLHACTLALMRTIDAKKSATMVVAPNKREATAPRVVAVDCNIESDRRLLLCPHNAHLQKDAQSNSNHSKTQPSHPSSRSVAFNFPRTKFKAASQQMWSVSGKHGRQGFTEPKTAANGEQ